MHGARTLPQQRCTGSAGGLHQAWAASGQRISFSKLLERPKRGAESQRARSQNDRGSRRKLLSDMDNLLVRLHLLRSRSNAVRDRFCRGERPAGRAELLAKRGCIGQMQISAELVPIPDASGCVPDASGFLIVANWPLAKFRQNFGQNLEKFDKSYY